ncbi:MAG: thioredoxin [Nitrososphaerota archaeon]
MHQLYNGSCIQGDVSEPDESELDRILQRKLRELMRDSNAPEESASFPSEPIDITDKDFDKFISRYPLVVVDFWADWCMPCRFLAPIVKELAKEMSGKVVFGKLNVDENPVTSSKFGIMSIPTLIIFKDGRPVDAVVGALPKSKLHALIIKHLH